MAKRKMTFDEFDACCERISELKTKPDGFWPTKEELNSLNLSSDTDLDYLIWLVEENPEPNMEKDKEIKKYINKLLRENIKLSE